MVGTLYFIKPCGLNNNIFKNNFLETFHLLSFLTIFDKDEPEDSKNLLKL